MKNTEELIGRKVRGFRFGSKEGIFYGSHMDSYIDKIGVVEKIYSDGTCRIDFEDDYFYYPADQIESHLVEEKEIPTLTDGVAMWVSHNDIAYEIGEVFFKHDEKYYAKIGLSFEPYNYCKPIEPTKEEQLTAILGSSDKVAEIMELFNDKK